MSNEVGRTWALILAAGDGSRLRSLTTSPSGSTLYRRLPTLDFSRDILSHETQRLRVLRVPACGWNDLGTPQRLLGVLRLPAPQGREAMSGGVAHLSLAAQHARLQA